jgi:ribosome-associated heat shock protein Hsp15
LTAPAAPSQRIDKWLWHARMVRTRTAAAALVEAGHVRVNGTRVLAAGRPVRRGDAITLALDRSVRVVVVEDVCERRGGAQQARSLYRSLSAASAL